MKDVYLQGERQSARELELERRVAKLEKINNSLMNRVERSMAQHRDTFSLFHTAIGLESQVRIRTEALNSALEHLEKSHDELVDARDASERANKVKTRFFTAVGHDLLQPLHAARLSLSALGATTAPRDYERLTSQIDHALSSIEDLLKTILDLSKLEAGVLRPSMQPVSLAQMLEALCLELSPIAQADGLHLRWRPTELMVRSDPLMLRRILQNLLVNAVRYTATGGVLIAARRRGDAVRIEVWDTGPGIAVADRERIFDEFQRGNAAETKSSGGFGLGLAIVQRMADTLDHRVGLCSRVGHGTCFYLYAKESPREEWSAQRQPSTPAGIRQSYGFKGINALVVDNDEIVVEAMRMLLEGWGGTVAAAKSPQEVEAILASGRFRPDVIMADYHLDDGATGTQVIDRVRAVHGKSLPAIVITADHSMETATEIMNASCEMLRKPVRPAELRALVAHILK